MGHSFDVIYNKALDAFLSEDFDTAEAYLAHLVKQAPFATKHSQAYNLLGLISHSRNKFNQAIKFFNKSLEINPKNTEARVNLSIILCDLGLYKDAHDMHNALYS